jgi:Helix-turn-helix domain
MVVPKSRSRAGRARSEVAEGDVLGVINLLVHRVGGIEAAVARLHELVVDRTVAPVKDWYTTGELAAALGRSQYTVQARWCAEGRIECEKDPTSEKWRIPAREYDRLVRGGALRAKAR